MIEIIGCILLIIIGVSFICMSVMLDKLEGTCQDCIYLEKIKPLFEKLEKENKILKQNAENNDKVIDKAIEYISSQMIAYDDGEDCGVDCECDGFKLLDILKEVE